MFARTRIVSCSARPLKGSHRENNSAAKTASKKKEGRQEQRAALSGEALAKAYSRRIQFIQPPWRACLHQPVRARGPAWLHWGNSSA